MKRVPARLMIMESIQKAVHRVIVSNWVTARIYFRIRYGKAASDYLLCDRIRQIGHRFDHRFMKELPAKKTDMAEMEHLLRLAKRRGVEFDDSIMWALGLYAMAKLKAEKSYRVVKRSTSTSCCSSVLSDIIKTRRSVRKWNDERIDVTVIRNIIETSVWAPSSCNRQPIRVVILDDRQKEIIRGYFPGVFWHSAPVQVLVLGSCGAYSSSDRHFLYLDGGAFIQNMLLLLHDAGLGACWIGFKKWGADYKSFQITREISDFYEQLNLSEDLVPVSMLAIGGYDSVPNAPARSALDDVIIGCEHM